MGHALGWVVGVVLTSQELLVGTPSSRHVVHQPDESRARALNPLSSDVIVEPSLLGCLPLAELEHVDREEQIGVVAGIPLQPSVYGRELALRREPLMEPEHRTTPRPGAIVADVSATI